MICVVCKNSTWKSLFDVKDRMFGLPGRFKEYKCTHCGLVRLQPKLSKVELTKYYPPARYYSYSVTTKQSFFGRLRAFFIAHEFFWLVPAMPWRGERGKILDVGCGSGDTLALLKIVGWDTYGLDIDVQAIKVAYDRGLHNVSLGTYKDLTKYPDNFFDAIRLYHVIEHLDDPEMCFRLMYKKLKKGGQIIIGTPNANSLVARVCGKYWYNLDCPRHLFVFNPWNLRKIAERNEFVRHSISFASAGGWVGSLQYIVEDRMGRDIDLINRPWLVMLFYPWEWLLDKMRWGDVFVLRARKS